MRVGTIDVVEAVDSARGYFTKLMPASDVRLEEVENSDDGRVWYVTLSALIPVQKTSQDLQQRQIPALAALFKPEAERLYKQFVVDAENGAVRSMKIRSVP